MTKYIRVKSKATKHEFDLPVQLFDDELYTRVDPDRYPETPRPRRPKTFLPLGKRAKTTASPDLADRESAS
ncbi:hypothetical protein [Microbacterium rhizophilus]|uniref:hypothetical protein n=1 Tax=Microbacterium rhizophilus TaxID=3138934 RepID=UPI0031E5A990